MRRLEDQPSLAHHLHSDTGRGDRVADEDEAEGAVAERREERPGLRMEDLGERRWRLPLVWRSTGRAAPSILTGPIPVPSPNRDTEVALWAALAGLFMRQW